MAFVQIARPVAGSRFTAAACAYVALTKPRIIELLLVTTVPSMMLAARGVPAFGLAAATLVGGTLAAGSANALNCFLDRDIDAVMARTADRPLNGDLVTPRGCLAFGLVLGGAATAGLWLTTNLLSALLTLLAIAFYVVVYTMVLKRRTASNIVWGGAAGCMPTLIGWSAVTGRLAWPPLVLFAVVFFWTPPHFWALAMRFRTDYAAAGVPMLPVVASDRVVTARIVAYSWVMVATSLVLWPVASMGPLYGGSALLLGATFLVEAHRLDRAARTNRPLASGRLFHWSISYLSLLFTAVALDVLIQKWW